MAGTKQRRHREEDRGQLNELDEEIHRVIVPHLTTLEDEIFLKQMSTLSLDRAFRTKLTAQREAVDRAAKQAPERIKEQAERDKKVARVVEAEEHEAKKLKERMRLAEERRKEHERQLEEERLARLRRSEEHARRHQEERERRRKEALERQEREAAAREEARREAARLRLEQEQAARADIDRQFFLYDGKWAELKGQGELPPLGFANLPWPVFGPVERPSDITYARLREFVSHPRRKGMDGKSWKDRVRMDVLKWHPDKFDAKVLGRVVEWEREAVAETAGVVARLLMQMMGEQM